MTGEDMERAIEFLLQSQGNHEARLGQITDQVNQLTDGVKQLTQRVEETNRVVQLQSETQTEFIQIVTRHIEAQGEINASLRTAFKQNDASMSRTDARLDRLEALVERYLEGRNGQN